MNNIIGNTLRILAVTEGVVLIYVLIIFFFFRSYSIDPKNLGEFGSFFGGVIGPILLALTLCFTVFLSIRQSKQLEYQQFEATFFNMLNLHNDLVSDITYQNGKEVIKGRRCFKYFWEEFQNLYNVDSHLAELLKEKPDVSHSFDSLFKDQEENLSHYFRYLYHIVKTINDSGIDNKKKYTNIVRAILSSYEHLLLFYNGIWYSEAKFRPLIIKYQLLENMPLSKLLDDLHKESYPIEAYGNAD